ncbi:SDR family NAD(P)-dependent oxidoreductase [Leptolyngbya sp. NK1-12]|uniref:SDR family NAD(P)-dependent oxidoreductase n=1 Tax=Leptolyngbya sp. NK1-12 TaxID=2547451 RepID=A0AA97AND0_9CYAN|nr:SDR family NAD(P)-dependent oxidoreductase [Leptolyngbya sp. NK1-12]
MLWSKVVQLEQQVILITGASTGIGAALAVLLASRYPGIRLGLAARSLERLEAVAATCRQAGAEVCVVPTDMAQPEQVKALAAKVLQQFGRVDALVSNAGYGQMGPIELVPTAAVEQQFKVNLLGAITLIQAVIPVMRQQGGGRIITVSSLGGRVAFPLGGLYSASKFALEGLSDALRMELEPFNIKVSVIEPGPVATEFFEAANRQLEKSIANLAETPYGAAVQNLDSLNQRLTRQAWSPEQVADVIIKALQANYPKPRYIAATGGSILLWLMTKVLPTKAVDLFWQRFYGVHLIKKAWQQRA